MRLVAIGGNPRKHSQTIKLGEQRTPQAFRYRLEQHRRTIFVEWTDSGEPFTGAELSRSRNRFKLSVLDLFPPDFAPDGTPYAIPAIAVYRCARIHLSTPLPPEATIIDAATGRRVSASRPAPTPHGIRCPHVRPRQHVNISPVVASHT
jgi:hypothetical protein